MAVLTALTVAVLFVSCSEAGTEPILPPPLPLTATAIHIISGDSQTAVVGTAVPDPLVVRVTDREGGPVRGHTVYFVLANGGGDTDTSSLSTDADGLARVRWTLGPVAGNTHRLAAIMVPPHAANPSDIVIFSANAVPGAAHRVEKVSGDEQDVVLGERVPLRIAVRVLDRYGNGVPGAPVNWTVSSGGRVDDDGETRTDATGRASAHWTIGSDFDVPHSATATVTAELTVRFGAVAHVPPGAGAPRIAFVRIDGTAGIYSIRPDGSDLRRMTPPERRVLWYEVSPEGGRIAYTLSGTRGIWISTWDGSVTAVLAEQFMGLDIPYLDWSPDGRRIVFQGGGYPGGDIYVTDARPGAEPVRLVSSPVDDANPRWSPDGRQIAFIQGSWGAGFINLMIVNADGSEARRIPLSTVAMNPRWSPDGQRIAFDNWSGSWIVGVDGSGVRPVTPGCLPSGQCDREYEFVFPRWSPDGRQLAAFALRSPELADFRLYALPPETGEPIPVIVLRRQPSNSFPGPQWSPDGSRIAFTAQGDGNVDIYTVTPDGSDRIRVTNWWHVDEQPRWYTAPASR